MRVKAFVGLLILGTTLMIAPALAQNGAPTSFRSGVDLVALDVLVTGPDGQFVAGLSRDDFSIIDGREVRPPVLLATGAEMPLATVLLIDRSSSMAGSKIVRATAAADSFLRRLGRDDAVEVLAFNQHVQRLLAFDDDHAATISDVTATGSTALFDAVVVAVADLRAQAHD